MRPKYFWLKERHNPQLGVYWVTMGNITLEKARAHENAMYGTNYMHKFSTEKEYEEKIAQLIANGERVS